MSSSSPLSPLSPSLGGSPPPKNDFDLVPKAHGASRLDSAPRGGLAARLLPRDHARSPRRRMYRPAADSRVAVVKRRRYMRRQKHIGCGCAWQSDLHRGGTPRHDGLERPGLLEGPNRDQRASFRFGRCDHPGEVQRRRRARAELVRDLADLGDRILWRPVARLASGGLTKPLARTSAAPGASASAAAHDLQARMRGAARSHASSINAFASALLRGRGGLNRLGHVLAQREDVGVRRELGRRGEDRRCVAAERAGFDLDARLRGQSQREEMPARAATQSEF